MKMLVAAAVAALLSVPVVTALPAQAAAAKVQMNPDYIGGIDRRGGRCFSREGSACGGV